MPETPAVSRPRPTPEPLALSSPPTTAAAGAAWRCPPGLVRFFREVAREPGRLAFTLAVTVAVLMALGALPDEGSPVAAPEPAAQVEAIPPLVQPQPGDGAAYETVARRATADVCPGLPPHVLVAIAQVESGLGRWVHTSARGAEGPMQFLPATFKAYATDGDGDGLVYIHQPIDALYTAASYLCANGGAQSDRLAGAIWNYNRSPSYVNRVLDVAGLR